MTPILLPYPDFVKSAKCFNHNMLIRVHNAAMQSFRRSQNRMLVTEEHPWKCYEVALCRYCITLGTELSRRGFRDTTVSEIRAEYTRLYDLAMNTEFTMPYWFGNELIHDSHKSYLLYLYPDHFFLFAGDVAPCERVIEPIQVYEVLKNATSEHGSN